MAAAQPTNDHSETRYRMQDVLWEPDLDAYGPRRARAPARIQAYVPAALNSQRWRFSSEATAAFGDAQAEISLAQQHADRIGLNTIAQQLLRSESMASSQMEGLVVPSHRSLAKAEIGKRHEETAQAALANIAAVKWAYSWAADTREPFSIQAITAIHERIAAADRWLAAHAGRLRERQNWIGSDPHTPVGADFIPPPPQLVPGLLEDLCGFLNRIDLPPVAQAAIAHVQFETIHPFPDGNGRVGRAIIGASLSRSGICRDVVPPISLVLAGRKADYIDALSAFRRGHDDPWLLLMAESAAQAAHASIELADQIAELQDQWREQAGRPRKDSAAEEIIRLLPAEPVLNVERTAARLGRSGEAVRQALNRLEAAGVVQLTTLTKRDRAWESIGVFALVDEMERRLSAGARGAAATH
jgi:Fic family protein